MCVGVGFALAYISLVKIDVSDWEVYVVVAHQFAFLGGLESTHLTGCLCDVVALSLEALLGVFSHCLVCLRNLAWSIIIYLTNFVVFFADVFHQFRELAEHPATFFTLISLHFMASTDNDFGLRLNVILDLVLDVLFGIFSHCLVLFWNFAGLIYVLEGR